MEKNTNENTNTNENIDFSLDLRQPQYVEVTLWHSGGTATTTYRLAFSGEVLATLTGSAEGNVTFRVPIWETVVVERHFPQTDVTVIRHFPACLFMEEAEEDEEIPEYIWQLPDDRPTFENYRKFLS